MGISQFQASLMPQVVMLHPEYVRSSCYSGMKYHWPGGYPGCPALLGGNIPYIGCGPSTTKLGLLQEIGQGTTFGGIKGGLPFPINSTIGYL